MLEVGFFLEAGAIQTLLMDSPSSGRGAGPCAPPKTRRGTPSSASSPAGPGPFLPEEPFLQTTATLAGGMGLRGTRKGNLYKNINYHFTNARERPGWAGPCTESWSSLGKGSSGVLGGSPTPRAAPFPPDPGRRAGTGSRSRGIQDQPPACSHGGSTSQAGLILSSGW